MKIVLMYPPSREHRAALAAAAPGATLVVAEDEASAARLVEDADAVIGNRYFLQSLPHARRLRWMQSNSVGVDVILRAGALLDGIAITCAKGVYDDEVAEHTVALVLAVLRELHLARDEQTRREWLRHRLRTVKGSRVLILGRGGIGRAIGQRLLALGAAVQFARRRQSQPVVIDETGACVWGPGAWRHALPRVGILILALPLTPETYHMVGASELGMLPRGAIVVNVGRGGTLDEDALVAAVGAERIGGAALDVLEHEPPEASNPVFVQPRILVSPHAARSLESPPYRWEALFVENLRRFTAGEPLLNRVDRTAGY